MSPLDPSEHTSAPKIASINVTLQATPSRPSLLPLQGVVCTLYIDRKGQGSVRHEPLFPFEVNTPNLSVNLL